VVRCIVKGAPDQLLARAVTVLDGDGDGDGDAGAAPARHRLTASSGGGTWPRTSGWASRACG